MTGNGRTRLPQIVCFGEILLRLASERPNLLLQEMKLAASFCGAEANVAVGLAGLGHRCRVVSALPDNDLAAAAHRALKAFDVDVVTPIVSGSRMGLFFLQPGAMARPSNIIYDRAGSAFASIQADRYDWAILLDEAEWLFVSGITAALGERPLAALRDAIAAARSRGMKIAFDTNYRPTLWQGREKLAAEIFLEISGEADLLFAGRRATAMMAGGKYDHDDPADGFYAAAEKMFSIAPRLKWMSATRRTVYSTDRQELTGLLADRAGHSTSALMSLENIVDRVGTGDAFAAGILHGILTGAHRTQIVEFAAACAQWAHSVPGDFLRASPGDIQQMMAGGGDVKR